MAYTPPPVDPNGLSGSALQTLPPSPPKPTPTPGGMTTTDQWGSLLPTGLGNDQQATQATSAMRQSPWYQQWLKQNNINPQTGGDAYGNVSLNDNQQQDLYNLALKNGIGLNNKYDQIDQNGQISEAHHKLRDTLIAMAIGGAAATGFGAAGIGPLAGAMGGASAAGAGGATAAGLGGVEAGATAGLGAAALPGAMAALPAISGGAAAGLGAGAGAAGLMSSLPGEMAALPGAAAGSAGAGSTMAGMLGPMASGETGMDATTAAMAGQGAGSLAAPDSIYGMLASNSPQMIPNSLSTSLTPQELALGGGGTSIQKILQSLGSMDSNNPLASISSLLGAASSGAKANRALQGNFAGAYDRNMLQAQTDAEQARQSAMHDLAVSSYLKNQKGGFTPPTIQLNGQTRTAPDYGFGYKAPSAEQQQGAGLLESQALKTLGPGGTYTPMPFSDYGTPGAGENALSTGASIAGMLPSGLNILKMFMNR